MSIALTDRYGGRGGGGFIFSDTWIFTKDSWTRLNCTGDIPRGRYRHAAAVLNDVMFIYGGQTGPGGPPLDDLYAFFPKGSNIR
jgi:Kelch motif